MSILDKIRGSWADSSRLSEEEISANADFFADAEKEIEQLREENRLLKSEAAKARERADALTRENTVLKDRLDALQPVTKDDLPVDFGETERYQRALAIQRLLVSINSQAAAMMSNGKVEGIRELGGTWDGWFTAAPALVRSLKELRATAGQAVQMIMEEKPALVPLY